MYLMWLIDQLRILYDIQYPHPYLKLSPDPFEFFNKLSTDILNIMAYDISEKQLDDLLERYFGIVSNPPMDYGGMWL